MLDFVRIACAVPAVKVGDVKKNVQDICRNMEKAQEEQVDLLLFPELAVTGYTCGDLFLQDALLRAVDAGMEEILACSARCPDVTAVIGLPVRTGMKLLNCAAVISGGDILGVVPKTYLPDYGGANESRWFSVALEEEETTIAGVPVLISGETVFAVGETVIGVELCEDLHAPVAPSAIHALSGAEVILNPAASPEVAGKRSIRGAQIQAQSRSCKCVYAYCSAGYTESTSDLVYSGHSVIAENGRILRENQLVADTDYWMMQDCDLGKLRSDRRQNTTFRRNAERFGIHQCLVGETGEFRGDGSLYPVQKMPFLPESQEERMRYCRDVFQLQVTGLKQRLATIRSNAVIGISGGLDSTLALLVAVEAMRQLDRPVSDVYGVTMPCFGTSDRTYQNSWDLMTKLGISAKEISIKKAVTQHFEDIGHDLTVHNGTYENSQARERTQILMDYASTVNGIVVGTGDLSELALGWCTYNGDHMSMYSVNSSIPKTMIRWIVEAVADMPAFAASKAVLMDVLDTPISPELLPPDATGKIAQQTEDLVGPYLLHDFYLYHMLRYGFTPTKIYTLACRAFQGEFEPAVIKKWLKTFYWRFFSQQFKRNCMPDGVKAAPLSLGPRGDWSMPSDAAGRVWLEEVDSL